MNEYFNSDPSNEKYFFTIGELKSINAFASVVKRIIENEYPYYTIVVAPHIKNNDLQLLGITIADMDYNMAPTIYLNSLYEDYQHGRDLKEICDTICKTYESSKPAANFPIEDYLNFENISSLICYELINYNANQERLKDRPFIPYLDFAIVFYVLVKEEAISGTITISNNLMEQWNLHSPFELMDYAHENTQKLLGFQYGPMPDFMRKLKPIEIDEGEWNELFSDEHPPMYVATTDDTLRGACCILYENALETFAELLNGNYYILPSSVSEVLLIPYDCEMPPYYLMKMVREVNVEQLTTDEILSDYVYLYDAEKHKLRLCTNRE